MLKRKLSKDDKQVKVTFVVPHDPDLPTISVVGDFNDWDPGATPLVRRSNNTRSAAVTLKAGNRYAFRYYTEDDVWFNDDDADAMEYNEFGTENCIIET